jgi:hypothetical protein
MSALEKVAMTSSPEAEIIRQIEELIRKLASGKASDNDLQLLHELQRERVELMRPKVFRKKVPA